MVAVRLRTIFRKVITQSRPPTWHRGIPRTSRSPSMTGAVSLGLVNQPGQPPAEGPRSLSMAGRCRLQGIACEVKAR